MQQLILPKPDDFHCHLRDGASLKLTVPHTAQRFRRALVMPNLAPPITTVDEARAYYQRIIEHVPATTTFTPLMTLYLTETTTAEELTRAKQADFICSVKLYPAHATTNAAFGIKNIAALYPLFAVMEKIDLPLSIHGEITDENIDVFDRETVFIEKYLYPLHQHFPQLRIIIEHISTQFAVDFVKSTSSKIAATITAHHLLLNRNDLFKNGLQPHHYCLPLLKTAMDQEALVKAAISGDPKFFLGTDSAPHARSRKESACGCAGIYTAHAAIEFYAEIFEMHHALDRLKDFACHFGANFYGLPINQETITLVKKNWQIPTSYTFADQELIPLWANQSLSWQIR